MERKSRPLLILFTVCSSMPRFYSRSQEVPSLARPIFMHPATQHVAPVDPPGRHEEVQKLNDFCSPLKVVTRGSAFPLTRPSLLFQDASGNSASGLAGVGAFRLIFFDRDPRRKSLSRLLFSKTTLTFTRVSESGCGFFFFWGFFFFFFCFFFFFFSVVLLWFFFPVFGGVFFSFLFFCFFWSVCCLLCGGCFFFFFFFCSSLFSCWSLFFLVFVFFSFFCFFSFPWLLFRFCCWVVGFFLSWFFFCCFFFVGLFSFFFCGFFSFLGSGFCLLGCGGGWFFFFFFVVFGWLFVGVY